MQHLVSPAIWTNGRPQHIAAQPEYLICADLSIDPVTDGLRPRIHPDGCIGKNLSVLIYRDRRPALSVNSDTCDLRRSYPA